MEKKYGFVQNKDGLWEKDGKVFPHVVEVRLDRIFVEECLMKNGLVPGQLVEYHVDSIFHAGEKGPLKGLYFVTVTPLDHGQSCPALSTLDMLAFVKIQRREIREEKRVPMTAFDKPQVAMAAEDRLRSGEDEEETTVTFPRRLRKLEQQEA